jgi:toxin ParE1/3/4
LRISRDAQADLRDIRSYSKASFGVAVARAYLDGLSGVFGSLRECPMIGVAREDLGSGVRAIGYRSHRIYYEVAGDVVGILRVLHHARDINAAFLASR